MILRDYQLAAMDACRAEYARGAKRVLLTMATGAGKTCTSAEIMRSAIDAGNRCAFYVHRREVVQDTAARLRRAGLRAGVVMAGEPVDRDALVNVCSIQTVDARDELPPAALVVVDECFVAGTSIATPDGDAPIESVRVGDRVRCASGVGIVTRLFRSVPNALLRVWISDGSSLVCTPGHPFFVEGTYIRADQLAPGSVLRGLQRGGAVECAGAEGSSGLLSAVREGAVSTHDGADEPTARERANDREQPDAACVSTHEDDEHAARDRAQAEDARRERHWSDCAAGEACERADDVRPGARVRGDVRTQGVSARVPVSLQDRHRDSGEDAGDRGGRVQPLRAIEAGAGRPQGCLPSIHRVDRVEVLEPGSDGRYGGLCADGHVYNLTVESDHTYFAGGVLVHNCHHATASTYRALLAAYPDAWVLGLSATPVRADGAALGDAFEVLVRGPSVAELTARGVLAPCDAIVAPSSSRQGIAMDEAEAVERYCGEQQTLVFVSTVARAKELAARTPDAAAVYGGMHRDERARIFTAFRVGAIRTIYNCAILTEGTDLPMASRVVLARTCGHVGLYLQIVGRVLRADPARPDKRALIVDLGDNVRTHGMPADPREFSLEGEPIRTKAPSPRLCPTCGAVRRGESTQCWRCETVYPAPKPVRVRAESLVPFDGDTSYSATKQDTYDRLCLRAASRGYKPGWVGHQFRARYGHWPTGYVARGLAHRVSA